MLGKKTNPEIVMELLTDESQKFEKNLRCFILNALALDAYKNLSSILSFDLLYDMSILIMEFVSHYQFTYECTDILIEQFLNYIYKNKFSDSQEHEIWEFIKKEVLCVDASVENILSINESNKPVKIPYIIREQVTGKSNHLYKTSYAAFSMIMAKYKRENLLNDFLDEE